MAYKDPEKKKAANARGKAKLLAKNPYYFRDWMEKDRQNNPEKHRRIENSRTDTKERSRAYYIKNKHKVQARQKSRALVAKGVIIKPERCEGCGEVKPLEIDHYDYAVWWDFNWYCKACHALATRTRLRAGINL